MVAAGRIGRRAADRPLISASPKPSEAPRCNSHPLRADTGRILWRFGEARTTTTAVMVILLESSTMPSVHWTRRPGLWKPNLCMRVGNQIEPRHRASGTIQGWVPSVGHEIEADGRHEGVAARGDRMPAEPSS